MVGAYRLPHRGNIAGSDYRCQVDEWANFVVLQLQERDKQLQVLPQEKKYTKNQVVYIRNHWSATIIFNKVALGTIAVPHGLASNFPVCAVGHVHTFFGTRKFLSCFLILQWPRNISVSPSLWCEIWHVEGS